MANPAHLELLREGVEHWNAWRKQNPQIKPDLRLANLMGGMYNKIDLSGASLNKAQLQGVMFQDAHLEGADLDLANLEGAHLNEAHLEGASLREANLGGADLRGIFFDKTTNLEGIVLVSKEYGAVRLVDADWNSVNLGTIDWDNVQIIGDEKRARTTGDIDQYRAALRSCRQLATELRNQGLGEEGDRFAYRGQLLQRILLRKQKKWGRYLWSVGLDLLAGYGYKPARSLGAYFGMLLFFALIYHFVPNFNATLNGMEPAPLSWANAILFSIISFHGRINSPPNLQYDGFYAWISVIETVLGMVVELSFIAAFTQRFLSGK